MMSFDPRLAAPSSAVRPIELDALTSAPSSRHIFTASSTACGDSVYVCWTTQLTPAAAISGVVPAGVARFGSAPYVSSRRITRRVARERGAEKRRLAGEVDPRHVAERVQPAAARRHLARPGVDVGAGVEQFVDEHQDRRAIDEVVGRVVLVLVVHVEVAVLDGGPERRASPEVVGVDVRAVLDRAAGRRRGGC